MSDPAQLAKQARAHLAAALNALQTNANVPDELMNLAEPIAEAMGVLHRIERSNGADLEGRQVALANVRTALDQLQTITVPHAAVDTVMEAVALSLSKVHALTRVPAQRPAPQASAVVAMPAQAPYAAAPAVPSNPPYQQPMQPPPGGSSASAPVFSGAASQAQQPAYAPPPHAHAHAHEPQPVAHTPQPVAHTPEPQAVAHAAQAQPVAPKPAAAQPAYSVQQAQQSPQQPAYAPAPQASYAAAPQPVAQPHYQHAQPAYHQPPHAAQPAPHPQQPATAPGYASAQHARASGTHAAQALGAAAQPSGRHAPVPAQPAARPAQAAAPEPAAPSAAAKANQPAQAGHRGASGPNSFDVELGAHSSSNFYKGLGGNDVIEHGGIFVATYKIPPIGTAVRLRVFLPGDLEFSANAVVQWTREGGTEPGFGARFTQIAPDGRQLVYRYTRNREPLFYDDL